MRVKDDMLNLIGYLKSEASTFHLPSPVICYVDHGHEDETGYRADAPHQMSVKPPSGAPAAASIFSIDGHCRFGFLFLSGGLTPMGVDTDGIIPTTHKQRKSTFCRPDDFSDLELDEARRTLNL